jgi:hypothetical protein
MCLCSVAVQLVDASCSECGGAEVGEDLEGVIGLGEAAEFVRGLS